MTLHAHLLQTPRPEDLERLQAQLDPAVTLTTGPELPDPAGFHVLISGSAKQEHLAASPHLHTVIVPWAGIPTALGDLLRDEFSHLALHNLHHNAPPVAELAMALLLAAAKQIVPLDQALRRDDWTPRYEPSRTILLEGKTALVLGYGAIGRLVARACQGLGMQVLAVQRSPESDADEYAQEIHTSNALSELLPRSHALIICLPLTPETEGLLGQKELRLLPAGAVLVNIGRGPIVQEQALYEALRDGHLGAAGLDVWYNYPQDEEARSHTPPSNYPFHELENVVLSPHRGGSTMETGRLRMDALAELLNALARGEEAPNRVDLGRGY